MFLIDLPLFAAICKHIVHGVGWYQLTAWCWSDRGITNFPFLQNTGVFLMRVFSYFSFSEVTLKHLSSLWASAISFTVRDRSLLPCCGLLTHCSWSSCVCLCCYYVLVHTYTCILRMSSSFGALLHPHWACQEKKILTIRLHLQRCCVFP